MSYEWLVSELRELGISFGDAVLVHSSMKGLGFVEGGPEAVIDALLTTVGEGGTVLFPTLTGTVNDSPEHPPAIDLATTPCWTGLIPETARQRCDAVRSIHPTHSVTVLGANREAWTDGHANGRSPCDETSPYYRLMEENGKILLLGGVTHESNTSLHCIEEIARVPYHLQGEMADGTVRLPTGEVVTVRNHLHRWQDRYSQFDLLRDFTRAADPLTSAGVQRTEHIGKSTSTLISAAGMRDVLMPILAGDPLFLLDQATA
jgi:aminoglycoside 3-N-acetyltransferase